MDKFERHEISTLDTYELFHFYPKTQELVLLSHKGILVEYLISDDTRKSQVKSYFNLQLNKQIQKAFFHEEMIFLVCEQQELIVVGKHSKRILQRMKILNTSIVSLRSLSNNSVAYLFESKGYLITLNLKDFKIREEMFESTSSEIIGAYLSNNEQNAFLIKKQGNLVIKNIQTKKKLFNIIINDENITSCCYFERDMVLYTGDVGGYIIETQFTSNDKC